MAFFGIGRPTAKVVTPANYSAKPQQSAKSILTIKTSLSIETLERLLTASCSGTFAISFVALLPTADGSRKVLRVIFDHALDREAFHDAVHRLS